MELVRRDCTGANMHGKSGPVARLDASKDDFTLRGHERVCFGRLRCLPPIFASGCCNCASWRWRTAEDLAKVGCVEESLKWRRAKLGDPDRQRNSAGLEGVFA